MNTVTFNNVEVASLKIGTASTGKPYLSGIVSDYDEDGKFLTTIGIRWFKDVDTTQLVKLVEFASLDKEAQKASKGTSARVRVHITGVLQASKNKETGGFNPPTVIIKSISEI